LLQRFFALIELADRPFISGAGPHSFGDLNAAKHVTIKNGVLGLAAHHGIHGNNNEDVRIDRVDFKNFEVAAVSLNLVKRLKITRCTATNRKDIPIIGLFSMTRFLQRYVDYLVDQGSSTTLNVKGNVMNVQTIQDGLRKYINDVHNDIVVHRRSTIDSDAHPEAYGLFHNEGGLLDGNAYGFVTNGRGPAVNGFPSVNAQTASYDVYFKDVYVREIQARVNEVIVLADGPTAAIDPVGSAFQTFNRHPDTGEFLTLSSSELNDAEYTGNAAANAQAFIAKAIHAGEFEGTSLNTMRNSISEKMIEWVEAPTGTEKAKLSYLLEGGSRLQCNGDTMIHVNKGVIGFKMDGASHVYMENIVADGIRNFGKTGSNYCGQYYKSHPLATLPGYGGAYSRGFTFAGSSNIAVAQASVRNIESEGGEAVGFDVLTNSEGVKLELVSVRDAVAGKEFVDQLANPTSPAYATGFQFGRDTTDITLSDFQVYNLDARQVFSVASHSEGCRISKGFYHSKKSDYYH